MKHLLLTLVATSVLAACTDAVEADATPATEESAAAQPASNVLADLGGERTGPVYTKQAGDTLALSGYDAVSYFGKGGPVEGSADFTVLYQGYEYQFANAEKDRKSTRLNSSH